MEELKEYIEDTLKALSKTKLDVIMSVKPDGSGTSEETSFNLQLHLGGLETAYQDILEKLNNIEE
jgi:hypothetical protein